MRAVLLAGILICGWAGAALAQTAPLPPASPPVVRDPSGDASAPRSTGVAASRAELEDLVEASRAIAKSTREGVDYARVVPDILQQILAKLDKIENKLDKLETAQTTTRKR